MIWGALAVLACGGFMTAMFFISRAIVGANYPKY
jgi:hypothetical protein